MYDTCMFSWFMCHTHTLNRDTLRQRALEERDLALVGVLAWASTPTEEITSVTAP